jgi:hypothetical protein
MPSFNLLNLVLKTVVAAAVVLLFVASLAVALIAGRADKNEVVLADCQSGSWACSPSGAATAMIDGGGMYRVYQRVISAADCVRRGRQVLHDRQHAKVYRAGDNMRRGRGTGRLRYQQCGRQNLLQMRYRRDVS